MSAEIEMRVIGGLMTIGKNTDIRAQEAMLRLTVDFFYNESARAIFKMIQKAYQVNQDFDPAYLIEQVSSEHFLFYEELVIQYWTTSSLMGDIDHLASLKLNREIRSKLLDTINQFEQQKIPLTANVLATELCYEISKMGISDKQYVSTAEMMADMYLKNDKPKCATIPSGIETIDRLNNGGFKEGSMITIAGRSGMGKTGFGVHLAHHIASNHKHHHVLFYSLEMSDWDIYEKQLASILGKQPAELSYSDKSTGVLAAMATPFTINTKPLASIDYIEVSARTTHVKQPISVIVVDYLSIVQNKSKLESHVLKQADIALRLSALAIELNCIVIALTQVNRDYSSRDDKCPITSDAADSSGSERSSSYWFGIYRPEVDEDDYEYKNQFIVKCRKNRFGNPWKAYFAFNDGTFGEVDQQLTYIPVKPMKGIAARMNNKV